MDLANKVSVVTGAGSGIGEAIVRTFVEAGARVVAVDLDPELPKTFAGLDPERVRCVVGDVAKEATAAEYTRTAVDAFGRIDVMIDNAGIACVKPITETPPDEWDRVMDVNVKSIYLAIPPSSQYNGGRELTSTQVDHHHAYGLLVYPILFR